MAKKRKTSSPGTVRERFCFYVDTLFGGNQRRTAEYLGCSQAVISKIILGKQNPGGRVLDLMAQHPKVNPAWLLTGEGEPLLAEKKSATDQGWPVPIAEELLPGPPKEYSNHLTGQMEYVAGSLYRETAYFYVVRDSQIEHILPGDRILLDADKARWRKNLSVLDGKLCAVQRHVSEGVVIELCQLSCHTDQFGETVVGTPRPQLPELENAEDYYKPHRGTTLGDWKNVDNLEDSNKVKVEDIVAIAVELFRSL